MALEHPSENHYFCNGFEHPKPARNVCGHCGYVWPRCVYVASVCVCVCVCLCGQGVCVCGQGVCVVKVLLWVWQRWSDQSVCMWQTCVCVCVCVIACPRCVLAWPRWLWGWPWRVCGRGVVLCVASACGGPRHRPPPPRAFQKCTLLFAIRTRFSIVARFQCLRVRSLKRCFHL